MAPSTPPPPSSERFAAFTIASSGNVVMSATRMSQVAGPTAKVRRGEGSKLRPLGLGLFAQVHRTPHADVRVVPVEKRLRRLRAALLQHLEEIEIRIELRSGRQFSERLVERNAMHIDAAVFTFSHAARQLPLVDQPRHEIDRAEFR